MVDCWIFNSKQHLLAGGIIFGLVSAYYFLSPFNYRLLLGDRFSQNNKIVQQRPFSCSDAFALPKGKLIRNAPSAVPSKIRSAYTMGGEIKIESWYLNQTSANSKASVAVWTKEMLNDLAGKIARRQWTKIGWYGAEQAAVAVALESWQKNSSLLRSAAVNSTLAAAAKPSKIEGLVIGSESPWLEMILLTSAGVDHVVTSEYTRIRSEDSRISTVHPTELESYFCHQIHGLRDDGCPNGGFDVIASFSSLEHAGLGRYGDPLDPNGDLKVFRQIHCLLKPNGRAFIGFPVGLDRLVWNAHRIYGLIRWPWLLKNSGLEHVETFLVDKRVSFQSVALLKSWRQPVMLQNVWLLAMLQRRERVWTLLSRWTKVDHLHLQDSSSSGSGATAQLSDVERSFSILKKVVSIPQKHKNMHR